MMTLLNLKHLYMGISWHSGISSWLGQKECKSGVELLFSRKIHLFSFAAIGINKERENRNILYWQKDLKNDVKRKTRWYTRNKAILEIKLGPGCEITSGHWTFLLTRHSCQMLHYMFLVPVRLWSQENHIQLCDQRVEISEKSQSIDVWIYS